MSPLISDGILYVAILYVPLSINQPISTLPSGFALKCASTGSLFTIPSRYFVISLQVESLKKLAVPICQVTLLSLALNIGDNKSTHITGRTPRSLFVGGSFSSTDPYSVILLTRLFPCAESP